MTIVLVEILPAGIETSADGGFGDVVTALPYPFGDAGDGSFYIRQLEEIQDDPVAFGFPLTNVTQPVQTASVVSKAKLSPLLVLRSISASISRPA